MKESHTFGHACAQGGVLLVLVRTSMYTSIIALRIIIAYLLRVPDLVRHHLPCCVNTFAHTDSCKTLEYSVSGSTVSRRISIGFGRDRNPWKAIVRRLPPFPVLSKSDRYSWRYGPKQCCQCVANSSVTVTIMIVRLHNVPLAQSRKKKKRYCIVPVIV